MENNEHVRRVLRECLEMLESVEWQWEYKRNWDRWICRCKACDASPRDDGLSFNSLHEPGCQWVSLTTELKATVDELNKEEDA